MFKYAAVAFAFGIAFFGLTYTQVGKLNRQGVIIGLGDSMTTGVLADTSMRKPFYIFTAEEQAEEARFEQQGIPLPIRLAVERPWLNFAVGKRDYSIASRLNIKKRYNFAATGAFTHNIEAQVEKAREYAEPLDRSVMLTLTIGANDFCQSHFEVDLSARALGLALNKVMSETKWKVLLTDVPQVPLLKQFEENRGLANIKCKDIKRITRKLCRSLLDAPEEELWARIAEFNSAWNVLGSDLESRYQDRFKYSPVFQSIKDLPESWMAGDCFHASQLGHAELADRLIEDAGALWKN